VAAGLYPDVPQAQKALRSGAVRVHVPDPKRAAVYDKLYARYQALGAFEERQRRGR
jgi:L-ribulokinase